MPDPIELEIPPYIIPVGRQALAATPANEADWSASATVTDYITFVDALRGNNTVRFDLSATATIFGDPYSGSGSVETDTTYPYPHTAYHLHLGGGNGGIPLDVSGHHIFRLLADFGGGIYKLLGAEPLAIIVDQSPPTTFHGEVTFYFDATTRASATGSDISSTFSFLGGSVPFMARVTTSAPGSTVDSATVTATIL